jgi:glyoxylase-like metal-dependent hydrolase (beta-lactamase superfamily II)
LVDKNKLLPKIYQTVVAKGLVDTNCYIVACPESLKAAVIDPGTFHPGEIQAILGMINQHRLQVECIINTHGHADHIAGNGELQKRTGASILVHTYDSTMLASVQQNGSLLLDVEVTSPKPARLLSDGDIIQIGNMALKVLHTPGHTQGSICLYSDNVLFSGDTLFAGSVGRTDLPGGSERDIIRSIKEKLLTLPDETPVRPGHGPRTTIGKEREENPFL